MYGVWFRLQIKRLWQKSCHSPFFRTNGVQKLASTALSPIRWKIWSAIFIWLFLLLDAEQLFHNLSTKRCSPANSSVTSHNIQQTWEAVFWNCSLWLGAERQAHNLFIKRCSKACLCGNKSNQTKNMRSYFCLAVLITWCRTAFSQPLFIRVFTH